MQKKSILKSSKGIISIYVGVCIVTFIIILTAIYMVAVGVRKNQITTLIKVKEVYEQDNTKIASIYENKKRLILEKLDVGSTVIYSPSGAYNWQAKYCSSDLTETTDDVLLESAEGKRFNISSWKVLSIDRVTGKIELVPSTPTTGEVRLQGAQGYNNAVKLLNDACSSLYANSAKGIEARSINIEDIENYMTDIAKADILAWSNGVTTYTHQVSNAYSKSESKYPVIYQQEIKSVINGEEKSIGIDLSEQQSFIEKSQATSITSDIGAITTATSIQPYHTYWKKDATYMSTAFKPYDEENVDKGNYYNLIKPRGTSKTYWVASRCVNTDSGYCNFNVRSVDSGYVASCYMYTSFSLASNGFSFALFPVVTLNISNITYDADSGYIVK